MKRFLAIVAFLWLAMFNIPNVVVHAQNYSFTTNNGAITIVGYAGPGGQVSIPRTIYGLPVISIGDYAFQGYIDLTSITIPKGVTSIGNAAFWSCTELTNVTIPSSVTSIGVSAFQSCSFLRSITLPNSVTSIGDIAFGDCFGLAAITLDTANSFYCSVDGVVFNKSQSVLIIYPGGKSGSYTIPNTVTSIAQKAFIHSQNLTSVTIPNSVTSIGASAFAGSRSLTSITIPSSVTSSIGDHAFANCLALKSVYFQGNAPSLTGTNVFNGDNNVTIYYLPGTLGWGSIFLGVPTGLWSLPYPQILTTPPSFGGTNRFGFTVSWATNLSVLVEASTGLPGAAWQAVRTNTLNSGSFNFSDPLWTNYPSRFYRVRSL